MGFSGGGGESIQLISVHGQEKDFVRKYTTNITGTIKQWHKFALQQY